MAVSGVYCNVTMNSGEGDISNKVWISGVFISKTSDVYKCRLFIELLI